MNLDSHAKCRFNADDKTNGDHEGTQGNSVGHDNYPILQGVCAYPDEHANTYSRFNNYCSTKVYTEFTNGLAICGFKDWRLPTIEELRSIQNYQANSAGGEDNSTNYFPNTAPNSDYITSTPSADGTGAAWCLNSDTGQAKLCHKQIPSSVRLVRGGKQ